MRDAIILLTILGFIPSILIQPHIGVLVWSWISYMNPHRAAWGIAYSFPFAMVIGAVTIVAWLVSREPKRPPPGATTALLLIFAVWITLTSLFAITPAQTYPSWDRTIKILIVTVLSMILLQDKRRLILLVWVIVVSIGFYGIKGGLFTIVTAGQYRVFGPALTFIGDNNNLALALCMVLPLMRFLHLEASSRIVRWGLLGAMALTLLAIISTYSRGGFLALLAVGFMMWTKSRFKVLFAAAGLMALVVAFAAMPQEYYDRITGIAEYHNDPSAQGRLDIWRFSFNLALDRPLLGGGFDVFYNDELYSDYNPDAARSRAVHSIYFQVLGEHGFIGLALFLALGIVGLANARWIVRRTRGIEDLRWARHLASMVQVSLVAYAVGGLFLSLAYYDLFYHLLVIVALTKLMVVAHLAANRNSPASRQRIWTRPAVPAGGVMVADTPGQGRARSWVRRSLPDTATPR